VSFFFFLYFVCLNLTLKFLLLSSLIQLAESIDPSGEKTSPSSYHLLGFSINVTPLEASNGKFQKYLLKVLTNKSVLYVCALIVFKITCFKFVQRKSFYNSEKYYLITPHYFLLCHWRLSESNFGIPCGFL
jgi:hypothetical protein